MNMGFKDVDPEVGRKVFDFEHLPTSVVPVVNITFVESVRYAVRANWHATCALANMGVGFGGA